MSDLPPSPTIAPSVQEYDSSYILRDLSIYIFAFLIFCCFAIKSLIIKIRELRELERIRNISGVVYDVELAQYDFIGCFNEKIYPNISNDQNNCIICFEKYENNERLYEIKKCKHNFHKHCINKWLNEKEVCPICRVEVMEI